MWWILVKVFWKQNNLVTILKTRRHLMEDCRWATTCRKRHQHKNLVIIIFKLSPTSLKPNFIYFVLDSSCCEKYEKEAKNLHYRLAWC